jgi:hypothetical protein
VGAVELGPRHPGTVAVGGGRRKCHSCMCGVGGEGRRALAVRRGPGRPRPRGPCRRGSRNHRAADVGPRGSSPRPNRAAAYRRTNDIGRPEDHRSSCPVGGAYRGDAPEQAAGNRRIGIGRHGRRRPRSLSAGIYGAARDHRRARWREDQRCGAAPPGRLWRPARRRPDPCVVCARVLEPRCHSGADVVGGSTRQHLWRPGHSRA